MKPKLSEISAGIRKYLINNEATKSSLISVMAVLFLYTGTAVAEDRMRCVAKSPTEPPSHVNNATGEVYNAPFIIEWKLRTWDSSDGPPSSEEKKGLLTTSFAPVRQQIKGHVNERAYTNPFVTRYTETYDKKRGYILASAQGRNDDNWSIAPTGDGFWNIKGVLTDYTFKVPFVDLLDKKYKIDETVNIDVSGVYTCTPCADTSGGTCNLM